MQLAISMMKMFLETDKETAYRQLLSALGLSDREPLSAQARDLLASPELRAPKNWRPLDYIQATARSCLRTNGDYTFNKIPRSTKAMLTQIGLENLLDARVIDLGCGVFDPLLQSIFLFCNGAQSVLAIDTEPCRDRYKAGFLTADMLADFLADPERWNLGVVSREELVRRALSFDISAFRNGDLARGIENTPIRYCVGQLQEQCNEERHYDLVVSFSVLEHVMDLESLLIHLRKILKKEGALVSQVDFSDHRQFAPGFHFWSFMTRDGEDNPLINGIRPSRFCKLLAETGFELASFSPSRMQMPPEVKENLREEYGGLSDDDLNTISAYFSATSAR